MTRLLAIAEWLFGPSARRDVFEPMLADREREIAAAGPRTLLLRIRWAIAIALAFLMSTPRMAATRVPAPLAFDLALRAAAFGTLAFVLLRWLQSRDAANVPLTWLATFAFSLPYTIVPVVSRIHMTRLPLYQQRWLTAAFVASVALMMAVAAEGSVWLRVALASSAPWLGFAGWRLVDPAYENAEPLAASPWMKGVMVCVAMGVAMWPVSVGFDALPRRDGLVIYVIAPIVILTLRRDYFRLGL